MKIPVFDAHCDTIFEAARQGKSLRRNDLHIDLERGCAFTPYAQIFAIWSRPMVDGKISEDYTKDYPQLVLEKAAEELLEKLLSEFYVNSDILVHCKSAADAKKAAEDGKIAAFIAIEGAELIGCNLEKLQLAYDSGVRYVNLCWNYDNALCGAANGAEKYGLTDKGREFVAQMQRMGMAVDLSHASEKAFWDVMEIAKRPVIVGHSNSKAACDNPRNITDEQFKAVVSNGGVVGINLCPDFLNSRAAADVNDVVRHIEHFAALGGKKNICLGGDLDGIEKPPRRIDGIESYDLICETMLRRNWPESLVCDIMYNNLMRYTEAAL
jgi:membrane dipeptidase